MGWVLRRVAFINIARKFNRFTLSVINGCGDPVVKELHAMRWDVSQAIRLALGEFVAGYLYIAL